MRIEGLSDSKLNIIGNGSNESKTVSKEIDKATFTLPSDKSVMKNTTLEKNSIIGGLSSDGSIESLKEEAGVLKDNLSAIFNKMDSGSMVKIDEEGVDINRMDVEEVVTVVEQIQIKLAMYCDDYSLANTNINIEDIKNTLGSAAVAYEVSNKFKEYEIKPTEENVSEAMSALSTYQQTKVPDEGTKAYLLKNNMEPTISNVYKAEYAGYQVPATNQIQDSQWDQMKSQVEKVVINADLPVTEENLQAGRWMIDNGIEVTPENYQKLQNLNEITDSGVDIIDRIAATMLEGRPASQTNITGTSLPWEETASAITTLKDATPEQVMALVTSEEQLTLDNLAKMESEGQEVAVDDTNETYTKTYRQLQEIRLMMTLEAGRTLEKAGVSINTTELSDLVEQLRNYEQESLNQNLQKGQEPVSLQEVTQINQVMAAYDSLKTVPSTVIGSVVESGQIASAQNMLLQAPKALMNQAVESYEALSTEIRRDLGDSMTKAIAASSADILSDYGYEDNEANRRAIRILAFNNMSITPESMDQIKNIDLSVNQLFQNMNPQTTLNLIREGIDPLESSVTDLADYFAQEAADTELTTEKYSEFLYRMDKNEAITSEEREKFISIYGMVNKFQKDGLNAVGSLVKQDLDLTMGNLLTAYMTRKDQGMELTADVDTGLSESTDKVSYLKKLFKSMENAVNPGTLSEISQQLDTMSPEAFAEKINNSSYGQDDPVYQQYQEMIAQLANLEEESIRMITDNHLQASFQNLAAAQLISQTPGALFRDFFQDSKEESEGETDDLTEALDNKDQIKDVYEGLLEDAKNLIQESMYSTESYMDMDSLRQLGNGMNLLNQMAQRNTFEIPYDNNGSLGIIHLKIIEEGTQEGKFSIKLNSENLGKVTVEGKVNGTTILAQILTDSREGLQTLTSSTAALTEELSNMGFEQIKLFTNQAKEQPELQSKVMDDTQTETIFKAAKLFIRNLTNYTGTNADIISR